MSDSYKVYASKDYVENKIEEKRVQPDWNQNDPTAADYVKNRTHWEESVVILPETELIPGEDNTYLLLSPWKVDPVIGGSYIIAYNGVNYECKAISIREIDDTEPETANGIVMGNVSLLTQTDFDGDNDNAPFFLLCYPNTSWEAEDNGEYCYIIPSDDATSVTLSIVDMDAPVHKLDPKFMHETVVMAERPEMGGEVVILPETELMVIEDVDEEAPITTPLSATPTEGATAKVTYNGTEYACTIARAEDGGVEMFCIGNTDVIGLPGGNPDAPFVMILIPGGENGAYGMVMPLDGATSITLSVVQTEEPIPQQLVMDKDGNIKWEDRTHWYYETPAVILEETRCVATESMDGINVFILTTPVHCLPSNGSVCKVTYNGTLYETICTTDLDEDVEISNMGNMGFMDDNFTEAGEPFVIMLVHPDSVEDVGMAGMIADISGILNEGTQPPTEIVLSIEGLTVDKQVIDKKYLPEEVNSYLENGKNGASLRTKDTSRESESYSLGMRALALGYQTKASGTNAVALGNNSTASGDASISAGVYSTASGHGSFAIGDKTTASGPISFAQGLRTESSGSYSHAEGYMTKASGSESHAEGEYTTASGRRSHAEGYATVSSGESSHADGLYSIASGDGSFARGSIGASYAQFNLIGVPRGVTYKYAASDGSDIRPSVGDIISYYSSSFLHASYHTIYTSYVVAVTDTEITLFNSLDHSSSTEEKQYKNYYAYHPTTASGVEGYAIGPGAQANGKRSMAVGYNAVANGENSYSLGYSTVTNGAHTTALGHCNRDEDLFGYHMHAGDSVVHYDMSESVYVYSERPTMNPETGELTFGNKTLTPVPEIKIGDLLTGINGKNSYLEVKTITLPTQETYTKISFGCKSHYSLDYSGRDGTYAMMVGNGSGVTSSDHPLRSNAYALDWDGNGYFAGDVYVQGNGKTFDFEGKKKLATESYVDDAIAEIEHPVHSVNGKTGIVNLTASDIGALSDTTAIPSIEGLATETYVNNKVAGLVDSAPETLNTLNELASALGDDPNFAATVAAQIGTKVPVTRTINNKSLDNNITLLASDIGADEAGASQQALEDSKTYTNEKIEEVKANVTDFIEAITDEEIDDICMSTLEVDEVLVDEMTGKNYTLYVSGGDLKMTEVG